MTAAFQVLWLAHLLGDFPFQPYALLRWKLVSLWGLLVHVLVHVSLTLPALLVLTSRWSPGLALVAVSHFLIDWLKIRLTRAGWTEVAAFLLDQGLHAAVLWGVVRLTGAYVALSPPALDGVRAGIAFLLVAFAGAILVFLVGAAVRGAGAGRALGFAPIPAAERWRGLVERTAILATGLLFPPAVWSPLAAAYLVVALVRQREERRAMLKTVTSVAWAAIVTLAALTLRG